MSKDRTGLYILVIFTLLNSCSASHNSDDALKILQKQFPQQTGTPAHE